ncbi:MAG: methionyl-tRNA formyltransferase [Oscillospiraceae bacterium]|jgi:methionyl-tRNA formyltransferase|nr:methionyl-tRNA formyltransferase [Oscillospiraceae bacterium]
MKIAFMGTPDFAVPSLERLFADGHDVAAVFTQPDRPKNRGQKLAFSPVKQAALGRAELYQPESLRDGDAERVLRALAPDVIVVVAYGRILPPEILEIPRLGCVNIHGSLLPKYRGSAPIQRAVLNGESVTGVTSMYMAAELDAGDIIFTKSTQIGEGETSGELFARLAPLGAELLGETLFAIERGDAPRVPQNHAEATFAPPLSKAESPVNLAKSSREIANLINGLDPWPGATVEFHGERIKLFGASVAGGALTIREVQAPGGKRMALRDFLRGHADFSEIIR